MSLVLVTLCVSPAEARSNPTVQCTSAKLKAVVRTSDALFKCHAVALGKGTSPSAKCLAAARLNLATAFLAAENKAAQQGAKCVTEGDEVAIGGTIADFTTTTFQMLRVDAVGSACAATKARALAAFVRKNVTFLVAPRLGANLFADSQKLLQTESMLSNAFDRAEHKRGGACGPTGDTTARASDARIFVTNVVDRLVGCHGASLAEFDALFEGQRRELVELAKSLGYTSIGNVSVCPDLHNPDVWRHLSATLTPPELSTPLDRFFLTVDLRTRLLLLRRVEADGSVLLWPNPEAALLLQPDGGVTVMPSVGAGQSRVAVEETRATVKQCPQWSDQWACIRDKCLDNPFLCFVVGGVGVGTACNPAVATLTAATVCGLSIGALLAELGCIDDRLLCDAPGASKCEGGGECSFGYCEPFQKRSTAGADCTEESPSLPQCANRAAITIGQCLAGRCSPVIRSCGGQACLGPPGDASCGVPFCGDGTCDGDENNCNCPKPSGDCPGECDPCPSGDCDDRGDSSGDPHIITFDRLAYDFQAVGEFVFTRSLEDNFAVQIRFGSLGNPGISYNTAIAMQVGSNRVAIYATQSPATYINGTPTEVSESIQLPGGGTVDFTSGAYFVTWPDSSRVRVYDRVSYLDVQVTIPEERAGEVIGLLGNANDDRSDDLTTQTGVQIPTSPTRTELYEQFGHSWRITQSESLFNYASGENTETFTNRALPTTIVNTRSLTAEQRQQAEQVCRDAGVTDPILLENCVLDVALTGDKSFATATADVEPPAQSAVSIVQNGDFSFTVARNSPTASNGWSSANLDGSGGWKATGGNPGTHFTLNSVGAATDPTVCQHITGLEATKAYRLSGEYRSFAPTFGNPEKPDAFLATLESEGVPPLALALPRPAPVATAWTPFALEFTAGAAEYDLCFVAERGDDSSFDIDNITLGKLAAVSYTVVPYKAAGYRYKIVAPGAEAGFEAPGYDDSTFSDGAANFGGGGCTDPPVTEWPLNTDILLRSVVTLPAGATNVKLTVVVDDSAHVFFNGHDLGRVVNGACARAFEYVVPDNILLPGQNLLAVRGNDIGTVNFLDIQLTATVPQ